MIGAREARKSETGGITSCLIGPVFGSQGADFDPASIAQYLSH
jgi:hypothetical protein